MKILRFVILLLVFSGSISEASASVPYTSVASGMAFAKKEDARNFFSMSQSGDKQAALLLMANCTANYECVTFEKGQELYLEEQAEYPLIKIRIKGDPAVYWTLNNVIGF